MQLAASHRAHPPPVPPRPSRQVVAEALKKSPGPCPTRQAPPPPNTKPWRPGDNDKLTLKKLNPGRTIIYESSKNNNKNNYSSKQLTTVKRNNNNNNNNNNKNSEFCDLVKSQECCGKSERTQVTENQLKRQEQGEKESAQLTCKIVNANEIICDNNNIDKNKNNDNNKLNNSDDDDDDVGLCVPIRSLTVEENRKDVVMTECALEQTDNRVQGTNDHTGECNMQTNHDDDDDGGDEVDTVTDGNKENLKFVKGSDYNNIVDEKLSLSSLNIENKNLDNINNNNVDIFNELEENLLNTGCTSASIILATDKCATVVVIDEPERKIKFNEDNNDNIQHQDWLEAGVRYSSTKIMLPGDESLADRTNEISYVQQQQQPDRDITDEEIQFDLDFSSIREKIAMSSLQGLPPLPRSLSGFNLNEGGRREGIGEPPPPPPTRSSSKIPKGGKILMQSSSRPLPPGRQLTTLDTQLAILRKEMFGLRQLDLSLLSQLWSLNESIQEFRQLLQDQEDRAPSPSSEEGDDGSYVHPPPPPRRPAPLLHLRPPRPPRPLRPPPSDESPSSEEYGAV